MPQTELQSAAGSNWKPCNSTNSRMRELPHAWNCMLQTSVEKAPVAPCGSFPMSAEETSQSVSPSLAVISKTLVPA